MNDINFIHHQIYNDERNKNPKSFIDAYESNLLLINNERQNPDNPNYSKTIQLTADYALMLDSYGNVIKSIPFMDKSIKAYEAWANYINTDVSKMTMYEALVFRRGIANYNLKKYNLATIDFQYLVDTYPDNDKYRNWLIGARTIKSKKYLNYIWMFAFLCFIWYSMATKDGDRNRDYFFMAAIIFAGIAILIEIINSLVKASIQKKQ